MLEFSSQYDNTITIKVGTQAITIPKMVNADWLASQQHRNEQTVEETTKDMNEEQKARFLALWQPAALDSYNHLGWSLSPEGIEWVIRRKLECITPPLSEDIVDTLAAKAPLRLRRQLSNLLTDAEVVREEIRTELTKAGESADPLSSNT